MMLQVFCIPKYEYYFIEGVFCLVFIFTFKHIMVDY